MFSYLSETKLLREIHLNIREYREKLFRSNQLLSSLLVSTIKETTNN